MRVRDVMTYGVIGVPETATLAEAVETMLRSRVSALFVFDADHALVGVLSEGDLLRRSELGTDASAPHWLEFLLGSGRLAEAYAHDHGRKVGEMMTANVEPISEDADLSEAVDLMLHRNIKRLPVLRGEAVVGVISRSDLLKGLWRRRRGATARIRTPRSRPRSRPNSTSSAGRRGRACASRWRTASSPSRARSPTSGSRSGLKVIAENTPGVTAVHDHMSWIEPNSGFYLPSPEERSVVAGPTSGDDPAAVAPSSSNVHLTHWRATRTTREKRPWARSDFPQPGSAMIEEPPPLAFAQSIERPRLELVERLRGAPTSFVVDAMGGSGALDWRIRPLVGRSLLGVALTCDCGAGDNLALIAAAGECEEGDVLVAATGGAAAPRSPGTCCSASRATAAPSASSPTASYATSPISKHSACPSTRGARARIPPGGGVPARSACRSSAADARSLPATSSSATVTGSWSCRERSLPRRSSGSTA